MKKVFINFLVFVLVFSTIGPIVAQAEESSSFNEDEYLVDDHEGIEGFDEDIYLDDSDDNLIDLEEPQFQVNALPLVPFAISVVVRLVSKWVGKQAVKKVSKHAAQRAAERGITARQFASAMSYGTKYVDKNTGAKILYHSPTKTTLVLDKAGKVVKTSYKQTSPKKVWKKKKW